MRCLINLSLRNINFLILIHSVLEYYTPLDVNQSQSELVKPTSTVEYEGAQNSVSTFTDKDDTKPKQVEPILDPLFFIK